MNTSFLKSGEVGNIGLKQLREQRETITSKWESVGLLEGLEGVNKENLATLFENQATHLLNETTDSNSSGSFEMVAFPIIRRVFSNLLANEIVSVQALNQPIGRLYFINPKISVRVGGTDHTPIDGAFSNAADNYSLDSELKRVSKTGGTTFESYSLYDGYYADEYDDFGTALFDRTSGRIAVKSPLLSGGTFTPGVTTQHQVILTGITTAGAGKLVGPVGRPIDSEEFISSLVVTANIALTATGSTAAIDTIPAGKPIRFSLKKQAYGQSIVDENGQMVLVLETNYPSPIGDGTYVPFVQTGTPVFTATYRVYSDLEDDAEMAEVSFELDYVTVDVGQPKKLRATYTPEVAQDATAFHSINVEAELTALLSDTMAAEIDRVIIRSITKEAHWIDAWDYNGLKKRGNTGISQKDYNQELLTKINQISAQIQKSTLRGGANWVVVSPEVAAIMNDLEYFHVSDASAEKTKFSMGIEKIGSLSNRYQVYVDPYHPAQVVLIGHKGDNIFHAGFIYCPYVPMMLMPKMYDYKTGKSVHIIMSRYATKMVNNRFYGKIHVDGLKRFPIDYRG